MTKTLDQALLEKYGSAEEVARALAKDERAQKRRLKNAGHIPSANFLCVDGPWAGQSIRLSTNNGEAASAIFTVGGRRGRYVQHRDPNRGGIDMVKWEALAL